MTNYDDLDREVAASEADLRGSAAKEPEPAEPDGARTDDYPFDYMDSEALASWNLRRIRSALGISQQEISDRLKKGGFSVRLAQTQIAKIERGERPWRVNEMFAIMSALDIEWHELFRGDGLADDAHMVMLAARLKFQQAEEREAHSRQAWREAVAATRDAGVEMCRTAARFGVEDPSVMRYLYYRYFNLSWIEKFNSTKPDMSLNERAEEADKYSRSEWQRYLSEAMEEKSEESNQGAPASDDEE